MVVSVLCTTSKCKNYNKVSVLWTLREGRRGEEVVSIKNLADQ